MSLWRRVARARLASQVLRRLRRGGVRNARYDTRSFSVRFTADGQEVPTVLELAGLLADRSGRRRDRRVRRNQFVDGFLRSPGVPGAWDEACPRLRPVLRGLTTIDTGVDAPLRRPAMPFLAEFVVIDQPETMTYVSADQLAGWAVGAEEVFAAARANLAGAELRGAAQGPTVVRFVDDGDAYWTSHLLLPGWLGRLLGQVGGAPVAFAPERGTLLVTAEGGEHLTELFAQAEAIYLGSARPISPMAYTADVRGRTVPYAVPGGHPLRRRVERAAALLAATEYSRQAEREEPAPLGEPRLSPIEVVGSDGGGWRTRTAWSGDEAALLPLADEIRLGDRVLTWDEVGVVAEDGFEPARYRVTDRP